MELFVNETESGDGEDDISDLQADLSGHDHEIVTPDFVGLRSGVSQAQNFAQDVATQTEVFYFIKHSTSVVSQNILMRTTLQMMMRKPDFTLDYQVLKHSKNI